MLMIYYHVLLLPKWELLYTSNYIFSVKDMGAFTHILGMSVHISEDRHTRTLGNGKYIKAMLASYKVDVETSSPIPMSPEFNSSHPQMNLTRRKQPSCLKSPTWKWSAVSCTSWFAYASTSVSLLLAAPSTAVNLAGLTMKPSNSFSDTF
jgi:hypothetical protein